MVAIGLVKNLLRRPYWLPQMKLQSWNVSHWFRWGLRTVFGYSCWDKLHAKNIKVNSIEEERIAHEGVSANKPGTGKRVGRKWTLANSNYSATGCGTIFRVIWTSSSSWTRALIAPGKMPQHEKRNPFTKRFAQAIPVQIKKKAQEFAAEENNVVKGTCHYQNEKLILI